MMWLYILFIAIGILLITVPIGWSLIKNRNKKIVEVEPKIQLEKELLQQEDVPHPQISVRSKDRSLYEKFIKEYDSGDLKFDDTGFRLGARITCPFGIAEGFKYINGRMEWGYVRLHTGVDRARGGTKTFNWGTVHDIVEVPFDFNRSNIIDYGDRSYGTLIQLFNDEYGFEMRIGHMHPTKDIIPWSYERLLEKKSFKRGWVLGQAGNYGDSSGAHTHTEFLSIDDSCEVFDILLEEKFGDAVLKEYTPAQTIREYRKQEHFKHASDREILEDWKEVKNHRGAYFANKYLYKYRVWKTKKHYTRYSSELLFNGL